MTFKHTLITLSITASLALSGCGGGGGGSNIPQGLPTTPTFTQVKDLPAAEKEAVIKAALTKYADYAISKYTASHADALALKAAVDAFIANPSQATLDAAKTAWLASRESYGITEILRLSNGPIDAEAGFPASFGAPEGQLNAWPLDENMIDYTTPASGGAPTAGNIIDTAGSFTPDGGTPVDATTITKDVIADLNENGGDANVATGYHAVEFLLWGQDQDYASFIADNVTHGQTTAGERPFTDYTTDANKERRKDYLSAAAELIVDDLQSMIDAWTIGGYKSALIGDGANAIAQDVALKQIMGGMGVFLKSELANERMAVAALTPSEEDEHSCFSDNTHRDIDTNYIGFKNILDIFETNLSPEQKTEITGLETSIDTKVKSINDTAKSDYHFDYQIVAVNGKLQNIVDAKNEMRDLGDEMIAVAAEYGVKLSDGDVTDPDETTGL
ncbi:MAG: imelysin [Sulfurovum sp.]|nr:MAG: imelysin [Sulfurovum sp.]